jgi:hypothetical protein
MAIANQTTLLIVLPQIGSSYRYQQSTYSFMLAMKWKTNEEIQQQRSGYDGDSMYCSGRPRPGPQLQPSVKDDSDVHFNLNHSVRQGYGAS